MTGFDAGEFDNNKNANAYIKQIVDSSKDFSINDKQQAELIQKTAETLKENIFTNVEKSLTNLNNINNAIVKIETNKKTEKSIEAILDSTNKIKVLILPGYNEINSIKSEIENIRKVKEVKLSKLSNTCLNTIEKMARELQESVYKTPVSNLQMLITALKNSKQLIENVDDKIKPSAKKIKKSISCIIEELLHHGKDKSLTITELSDLKPVTPNTQISSMLKNMRIGYLALPVAALLLALFILKFYKINKNRADEIRAQLEARRGKV
jgi:hypothetical protein